MRDNSTNFKSREFAFMEGVALGSHSGKICAAAEKRLDRHRKEPRAVHAPGVSTGCCLSYVILSSSFIVPEATRESPRISSFPDE